MTVEELKEHVETILDEKREAAHVAEREREKAASALRVGLERAIAEGDTNLRDHVSAEIRQVNAAFVAAELLEKQRIDALREEMRLIYEAAEKAIDKAELQSEKWRMSQNEWRGQSADRERTQEEQLAKQSATFLPRETFESVVAGWQAWRVSTDARIAENTGARSAQHRAQDRTQPWAIWAAGIVVLLLIFASNAALALLLGG